MRKMFSVILCVCIIFISLPLGTSAITAMSYNDSDGTAEESSNENNDPEWPNPGAIHLDKSAELVEDNLWEITLSISGKNISASSDVVLVIDVSSSMDDDGKMLSTKNAAKQFVNNLIKEENPNVRIAIVYFSDKGYKASDFKNYENKSYLISKINSLYAYGPTNMQSGLHRAYELLSTSEAENKSIVILGDGKPTMSCYISDVEVNNYELLDEEYYCYYYGSKHYAMTVPSYIDANITCNYEKIIGTGEDYEMNNIGFPSTSVSLTCEEHNETSSYNIFLNHGATTVWEATNIKNQDIDIYSIALQAGEIGSKVLKAVSTDFKGGYYYDISSNLSSTEIEQTLQTAFENISNKIVYAAKSSYVTDPMGEWIDLVSSAEEITVSQGSIELNNEKNKITWKVGEIVEGKTATMKYLITLKENAPINELLYTNGTTTFYYINYKGESTSKDFDIPLVNAKGGSINIHYYRVNEDGEPVNSDGVVVESPMLAQVISESEIFVYDGSAVLQYNSEGYNIQAQNLDGYIYNNYYLDNEIGEESSVKVPVTASKPTRNIYFGYTLNNMDCSLTIIKSGETEEKQSYIFEITIIGKNEEIIGYFYEVLQGNSQKKIENLSEGTYIVREVTNWSWQYGDTQCSVNNGSYNASENGSVELTSSDKDGVIEFNEIIVSEKWLTDDAYAINKIG